ncbi:unnamed protein product [Absidia cylindrospora]
MFKHSAVSITLCDPSPPYKEPMKERIIIKKNRQIITAAATTLPLAEEKIVGGALLSPQHVPWLVTIGEISEKKTPTSHLCVGIALNPNTVLTVAHCVQPAIQNKQRIGVGAVSTTGPNTLDAIDAAYRTPVGYIYVHPNSHQMPAFDVAILMTREPIRRFNGAPARLLTQPLPNDRIQQLHITSWASVSKDNGIADLKSAQLKLKPQCATYPYLICTTSVHPAEAPCRGDDGAPLVAMMHGQLVVAGIAFTPDHIPNGKTPEKVCTGESTFIAIPPIMDWIKSVVGQRIAMA